MMPIAISLGRSSDLDVVEALLEREHLPILGLRDQQQYVFVARDGEHIVGCASVELYGDAALLRSVAVDAPCRGSGAGSELIRAALAFAGSRNVSAVYLLTNTAERFFSRFGFELVPRFDVPDAVRRSPEFADACCASASVMRRSVTAPSS